MDPNRSTATPSRRAARTRTRRALVAGLSLALLAVGCARVATVEAPARPAAAKAAPAAYVFPAERWERIAAPEAVGFSREGLDSVVAYVRTLETTGLMAVVGGRVLLEYGDVEGLSYLASVRKSILAVLYGKYVADGTIGLGRTLEEVGIGDHGGLLPAERRATVEHLITARSGVYHAASNGGDDSAAAPPRGSREPGSYYLYNNWDFNAAGAAFERLTGRDLHDALESDLARPIGMQDFDRSRQRKSGNLERSVHPAYHMWLSTRDMARVGYLMLREGEWNGRQLVPRDWARRIVSVVTPVEEMNPDGYRDGPFGYGYMWWVWDGPRATGAFAGAYTGIGAYGQFITVLPALDMVVAHKTAVPPERRVGRDQYLGILERLVAARCAQECR